MTTEQDIRRQVATELDMWMPDIISGRVSTVELLIRGYRKPGEQVASSGKRDPSQLGRVAKD